MSSQISLNDRYFFVSNSQLSSLVSFALEVAGEFLETENQREWTQKLGQFERDAWPGIDFDLNERFPTIPEKKFWAAIFHNVARRIFLRELGKQETSFWQSSMIGDAYLLARLLTRAVQEIELGWHPETENSEEGRRFYEGDLHIQL